MIPCGAHGRAPLPCPKHTLFIQNWYYSAFVPLVVWLVLRARGDPYPKVCAHIDRLAKPSRFEQKICGETVSYSQGTSLQTDSTMKGVYSTNSFKDFRPTRTTLQKRFAITLKALLNLSFFPVGYGHIGNIPTQKQQMGGGHQQKLR